MKEMGTADHDENLVMRSRGRDTYLNRRIFWLMISL